MTTAIAETHEMRIMDTNGDTKLIWDPDRKEEVKSAKKTFEELTDKGYVAYRVNKKGDQGEVMTEFDKDAEKIILAPQLRGG